MNRSAVISRDGLYRYALRRVWQAKPTVLFIGLNPSTADQRDDPTLQRCIRFAMAWGFGRRSRRRTFFALSSPSPRALVALGIDRSA
jgi:hypothetical protein